MDDGFVDDTLTGNEIIEEAIRLFYQENSDRGFMGICMAIRKRMQEEGHLIFPARVIEEEDTAKRFLPTSIIPRPKTFILQIRQRSLLQLL